MKRSSTALTQLGFSSVFSSKSRSRRAMLAVLLVAPLLSSSPSYSDNLVVIVNRDNPNTVDLAYINKIYSGSLKAWPDGSPVFALDHSEESDLRAQFSTQVLNRSVANMRAIWSQNIFTGKGLPPKVVSLDTEMKRLVATNRNAIGYIRTSQLDGSVKVIER
jgi:ABC-type phosphate transport system substrate-binding protein